MADTIEEAVRAALIIDYSGTNLAKLLNVLLLSSKTSDSRITKLEQAQELHKRENNKVCLQS